MLLGINLHEIYLLFLVSKITFVVSFIRWLRPPLQYTQLHWSEAIFISNWVLFTLRHCNPVREAKQKSLSFIDDIQSNLCRTRKPSVNDKSGTLRCNMPILLPRRLKFITSVILAIQKKGRVGMVRNVVVWTLNLVPWACDPWEGTRGSGIIGHRKPEFLAFLNCVCTFHCSKQPIRLASGYRLSQSLSFLPKDRRLRIRDCSYNTRNKDTIRLP